jgi:GxxExxY protein
VVHPVNPFIVGILLLTKKMRDVIMIEKDELTYKIIGCAMEVHNTLGGGFQEVVYQRCLEIELKTAELSFVREQEHPIYYKSFPVASRRADFVVEDRVVVELKALTELEDVHIVQTKNYTVAYDFPVGLLLNFGSTKLHYKRIFNPKYYPKK